MAGSHEREAAHTAWAERYCRFDIFVVSHSLDGFLLSSLIFVMTDQPPNKSPEPTADGAFSSAVAVHVASRRWLSFLR